MNEVGFPEGKRYYLTTNIIVENLYDSASDDRYHHIFPDSIADTISTEEKITKKGGYFITSFN